MKSKKNKQLDVASRQDTPSSEVYTATTDIISQGSEVSEDSEATTIVPDELCKTDAMVEVVEPNIEGEITTEEELNIEVSETDINISAKVAPLSTQDGDDPVISIEDLRLSIVSKIQELEGNETFKSLCKTIKLNNDLFQEIRCQIGKVAIDKLKYANKCAKQFSDTFLDIIKKTEWFDSYYDAICLYGRANDSTEALEWSKALRESLDTSIEDVNKEDKKIKALLNHRLANPGTFTLSLKTPFLRIKDDLFKETRAIIVSQSSMIYTWLKKIENFTLSLKDRWLSVEFPGTKDDRYFKSNYADFNLEKIAMEESILQYVENYFEECSNYSGTADQKSLLNTLQNIEKHIKEFSERLEDIHLHYSEQYEANKKVKKYLETTLLEDIYTKDLKPIYEIYDGIRLAIDYILQKYGESEDTKTWCSFLEELAETITNFLGNLNINPSPKLEAGKSHYANSEYIIGGKPVDFFTFAEVSVGVEAPTEELQGYVESIREHGFYYLEGNGNFKIIRMSTVAVYAYN